MAPAAITFTGDLWRWPAAVGMLLAGGLVLWSYRHAAIKRKWLCAALKLAGLALLALCVLEPQWTRQRVRPGANLMVVLVDNSSSLQITDEGGGQSRAAQLKKLLDPAASAWQTTLADSFELRRYRFDQSLQNVESFAGLTFDGKASALGASLQMVAERFRGRPLAGIVLLTDGNATDLTTLPTGLSGVPPIYPVVTGSRGPARDLSIRKVSVTQTAFEDAPVTVDAEVGTNGSSGTMMVARFTDSAGKVLEEQQRAIPVGSAVSALRFQLKPAQPGVSFYQLSVRDAAESGEATREATLANNQRVVVVDRDGGPYRILYVSGRPNWEYKFLNRALGSDTSVQLSGLVRVARREPKFSFLGRAGETSNPLFRGTEDQAKGEVAAYDQPVLVRLNLKDEVELRAGFPSIAEDLFGYHAVIVDDLESAFFNTAQAALLQRFVSERGGGFLMLGGMESFAEGGYARTPIGDMLPVSLDRPTDLPGLGAVQFDLDRQGWLQPWARLRANEADERLRLSGMPPLQVLNRVRGVKAGAEVIATATDKTGGKSPALVVQRFGKGRTAALTIGDLWRWGMASPEARVDLEKSWRQLVRWLVADVPGRVALTTEPKADDATGAVDLQVRVRDAKFLPVENATVSIEVQPVSFGGGAVLPALTLQAEPSPTEPGLYLGSYVPRGTGGYKATARAVNAAGAEAGRATAGWATDLAAQELRSLTPDTALLESLARLTGGAMTEAAGLEALAARLPREKAPVMESSSWIFLTAISCLATEWGLRRTQGLP
jgi:uncharacterized membrane protein